MANVTTIRIHPILQRLPKVFFIELIISAVDSFLNPGVFVVKQLNSDKQKSGFAPLLNPKIPGCHIPAIYGTDHTYILSQIQLHFGGIVSFRSFRLQVSDCQKLLFVHQLTHNTDRNNLVKLAIQVT